MPKDLTTGYDYETYLIDRGEREREAMAKFLIALPEFENDCWKDSDVEDVFRFQYFIGAAGCAVVDRKSDGQVGYLYFDDRHGSRIYFGFRNKD
jgi:hypothetical protein